MFKCRNLLVLSLLIVLFHAPVGQCDEAEEKIVDRLDTLVRPTSQSIQLYTDPRDSGFTGETKLQLTFAAKTSRIRMHAQDITIDSCVLVTGKKQQRLTPATVKDDKIDLIAAEEIKTSKADLRIWFHGPYNRQAVGLYKVEVDTDSYLFTQFQEKDARRAFPCFDQPEFKIPFDLTLTVPTHHLAVSNTMIKDSSVSGGMKKIRFATTKPLPTYLVAICVGPFDEVAVPNMRVPMRIISPRGGARLSGEAVRYTKPIFDWLENYFGIPYPYDKLDFIAVPEFWAGAMENAGAITYRESVLLIDSTRATKSQMRFFVLTHAHEIAHQWFGDLVTMKWWDDLWLNESFAEWMASECIEPLYPDMEIARDRIDEMESPRRGDMTPQSLPIRPKDVSGDNLLTNIGSVYNKGLAVLSMFQNYLGRETFRTGIQNYLRAHAFKNAVADDLWVELSKVSGQDMSAIMGPWITQAGVPVIRIDSTMNGKAFISQQVSRHAYVDWSEHASETESQFWPTPLTIHYDSAQVRVRRVVLLDKPSQVVTLPGYEKNAWLYPIEVGAGYYRWSLCTPVAQSLSASSHRLTSHEKVEWLYNLRSEFVSGWTNGAEYLSQIVPFLDDPDVSVATEGVDRLSNILGDLFVRQTRDSLSGWLGIRAVSIRERVSIIPQSNESAKMAFLRPTIVGFLQDVAKDSATIQTLYEVGERYFKTNKVEYPSITGRALAVYLQNSDLFDSCVARFERAKNPQERGRYLGTLSDFRKREYSYRALAYALSEHVRPQELLSIPIGLSGADWLPEDYALDWVIAHFNEISRRIPPNSLDNPIGMGNSCSPERFAKVASFFGAQKDKSDYMMPTLKRTEARIMTCSRMRAAQSASAREWLVQQGAFSH